jgi:hypothetical protein
VESLLPQQVSYKVARDGVEIGEHNRTELLQLYFDQKIILSDYLWRDGLTEWQTLYDLYTEFLETPEQLRAYDRELQMMTKTSYRIKYLINKSRGWIKEKRKQPAKNKKIMAELEKEVERIKKKIESAKDVDEEEELRSELLRAEAELDSFQSIGDGRDDEEYVAVISEESKEQIEQLINMRVAFWWVTFDRDPPKLNKKDLKRLSQSYESRVSQILRGGVPWSSNYFELGSLFSMPLNRTLHEAHGKNYIRPTETQIKQILKKLDEETPDWDDQNPEMFYLDLKPINPT